LSYNQVAAVGGLLESLGISKWLIDHKLGSGGENLLRKNFGEEYLT